MSDGPTTAIATSLTPRAWLAALAKREQRRLLLASLWGVLAGAQTVLLLIGIAWLVDQIVVHQRSPYSLLGLFAALIGVVLLRALFQWLQESASIEASLRIRQYARQALLDKMAALGPVWLAEQQSGALASSSIEHIDALDGYFARFYPQMRLVLLLPLGILAVVWWFDYLVALFLVLSAPLIPLFMALVGMGAERLNRDQFLAVSRLSAHFVDRIRGITTLQLFGHTRAAQRDVWYATDNYRRLSMRTLRLAFLSSAVLEFFASVAIAVVAIYVGFGLLGYISYGPSAALTLFSGLAVLLLAPEFFQPLRTLSQYYHDRAAALGAAESVVAILNTPTRLPEGNSPVSDSAAVFELVNVAIAYPEGEAVLSGVNLQVKRNDVVVITGASGSGKSSLLALMAGFMAPYQGQCRFAFPDGFAWLDQSPCILHGTLADNLRLADPDASAEAMTSALERAGLGELLAQLPAGLEAPLGERGTGLSGGQIQRVALARVYLSNAPVVLLDEPTASLDAVTEQVVLEALLGWAHEGRTLVMATHHKAVIAAATHCLVCQDGELHEVLP